ncbi:MAG: type I-E CRISPR-associated protein Cse1/CasA [Candidatus Anammoxibacter sp.]
MNLIGDPWLPVVFKNGQNKLVSLEELYEKLLDINDLTVNPPERISLMRLLICITQAALDGPNDTEDWFACRDRIKPESMEYLEQRKDLFNLYGEKPFMQISGLEADKEAVVDKLDMALASGNNATLFDHMATSSGRTILPCRQAVNLINFLNFSTGGRVGQATWAKHKFNESTFKAPCIKVAHTFIKGSNMLKTIFFNLLSKEKVSTMPNSKWGKPVWDFFPEDITNEECFTNAGSTYLGRLVPLSRYIMLKGDNETKCVVGPTQKTFSLLNQPTEFREPSTTVVAKDNGELKYLYISAEKHIWRELDAVLMITKAGKDGGAFCLQNIHSFYDRFKDDHVDIWVGGLQTGAQEAKLHDLVEWNFSIPISLFDENNMQMYKDGVLNAEKKSWTLKSSINSYCTYLSANDLKGSLLQKTVTIYWNTLNNKYKQLIDIANKGDGLAEWKKLLFSAALNAYTDACPHQTPRQIQAFAIGKRELFKKYRKNKS